MSAGEIKRVLITGATGSFGKTMVNGLHMRDDADTRFFVGDRLGRRFDGRGQMRP